MRVQVTQQHIDNGKLDCRKCPVANALSETPELSMYDLAVGKRQLYGRRKGTLSNVWFGDWPVIAFLPDTAQAFVDVFDAYQEVQPFEFELELLRDAK